MKRKQFLMQSGVLAGGWLLHQSMLSAFATGIHGEKIRLGIIGCGDRGTGLMKTLLSMPEEFEVVAICDVLDFRLEKAGKMGGSTRIRQYKDYRKLLDDKQVQAVLIATPLNLHYINAVDSLAAGKHVYLEKAMTYNSSQAIDLVKKAGQQSNLVFQVGHQYRYTPLYFKVKEMIEKGYLGKVTQIDCRWDRNWNWRRAVPAGYTDRQINWRMYKEYSGGLAAELLSHQIDFINWAFRTHPDEVFGTGGIDNYKDGRETFDNIQVTLRYDKDNMIGNFGATCSNARDGYLFKLKGTKGTISLLMNDGIFYPEEQNKKELQHMEEVVDGVTGATKITWNKEGGIPLLTEPYKDGTWYALKDFNSCITKKSQPASNVITGGTTAICVHMANTAVYNRTIEKWKTEYDMGSAKS